ncbi:MAG: hypothetical protein WAS05_09850 [Candidatus Nanopelagicales bacterium]
MRKLAAILVIPVLVAALAACGGTSSSEPTTAHTTALPNGAELVQERYGDCIKKLQPIGEPTLSGETVIQAIEGGELTWRVGVSNTGNPLTIPQGSTVDKLEKAGC